MREHQILGSTPARRRTLTTQDPTATPAPDLISQDFTAPAPGQRLVGDITYQPTEQGWLYLATVTDLHTREVIGHATAHHMRAELVCDAITLATNRGLTSPDAIFHSDRGSQYTSAQFHTTLTTLDIRPSMGRVGSCYDNAVAESFFATLKTEIGTHIWTTRQHAHRDVFTYLSYYNHHRLHSTLSHHTPHETRINYHQHTA
ncbi:hypothetical protein GCM10029964_086530 [Kibdelosporangium lantanae]